MVTYSAFFSSGLLAPRIAGCTTPVIPASSMTISATPVDPVDRQSSVSLAPPGQISPCPRVPEAHANTGRPRMRRRRSSANVGTSPMALIKSPVRNAGAALQRAGLMSPTCHRATSVSMNEASGDNSLLGRLRSGSVGGIANSRKRLHRAIRIPVPLVPPPSAPLPALPPSPTPKCAGSLLPPAILVPPSRQPLTTRMSLTDNVENVYSPNLPSPALLSPDHTPNFSFKLSPGLLGPRDGTIGGVAMEN